MPLFRLRSAKAARQAGGSGLTPTNTPRAKFVSTPTDGPPVAHNSHTNPPPLVWDDREAGVASHRKSLSGSATGTAGAHKGSHPCRTAGLPVTHEHPYGKAVNPRTRHP